MINNRIKLIGNSKNCETKCCAELFETGDIFGCYIENQGNSTSKCIIKINYCKQK
jgi:hypothetical protein